MRTPARAGLGALLAATVLTGTPPPSHAAPADLADLADLAGVARAAVAARNEYLVSGRVPDDPAYARWFAGIRPDLDLQRRGLADAHIAYTSHAETFDVTARWLWPGEVGLRATGESAFGMTGTDGNTGVPAVTAGEENLRLLFAREDGAWVLRAGRTMIK